MMEWAAALEGSALAGALRRSVWVYPLVNAGHILGIAVLVGSVIPMDIRILQRGSLIELATLRAYAVVGLLLAVTCGLLLFIVQAGEYLRSTAFQIKIGLIALALCNAALHLRTDIKTMPRAFAAASLLLWISALIAGRMIAYR
jgi:hypothetical protein